MAMIGGRTRARPIATSGEYGVIASPRPPKNAMIGHARGDQHRAEADGVEGVQHAAAELRLLRRQLQQVLVEHDVGGDHDHPRHTAVGVEAEDRVEEVEHVGFHQDQRDQQVEAEEHQATGVGLGDPGERVGPRQRAGVGVRHVDLDLADHDEHDGQCHGQPVAAGSSGRSPGTGAPAGWRCPRCRRRWRSGRPRGTVRRSA